jgi:hypothetical protein
VVLRETVRRNRVRWGIVYLQVTRGVARATTPFHPPARAEHRGHRQPTSIAASERMASTESRSSPCPTTAGACRHQVVSLLPNVLAKQAAREQGAREAWFVDRQGGHRRLLQQRLDRDAPARWSPATPTTRSCGASPATVLLDAQGAGPELEERPFHGRGGACGPRSLHHLGQPDRDAGGPDRRPARSATAPRAGRHRAAARFPSHAEPPDAEAACPQTRARHDFMQCAELGLAPPGTCHLMPRPQVLCPAMRGDATCEQRLAAGVREQ